MRDPLAARAMAPKMLPVDVCTGVICRVLDWNLVSQALLAPPTCSQFVANRAVSAVSCKSLLVVV